MTGSRRTQQQRRALALALALAVCLGLAACAGRDSQRPGSASAMAGSSIPQTGQEALAFLEGSLRPCEGGVEFTLPEGWPGGDWNIQILGRAQLDGQEIGVRVLETVNETGAWQAGGLYQIECGEDYRELNLSAALNSAPELEPLSVDLLALAQGQPQPEQPDASGVRPVQGVPEGVGEQDMTQRVSAAFPADQEGRNASNGESCDQTPFTVSFLVPQGWSLREPEQSDRVLDQGMNTPLLLCDSAGNAVGRIGCGQIGAAAPGEEPEAGEAYKLVYSALRTPSGCYWEDYRAVKKTAAGENAVATVHFGESEPGSAAEERTAHGALAYDRELGVYVALRMEEDAPLTADQVETLAQSLTLAPAA